MSPLDSNLTAAFRRVEHNAAAYGHSWWEHNAVVEDLCRRVPGLRLKLYELQDRVGEVTTADVYGLMPGSPLWPDGWRAERHPAQKSVLRSLPQSLALLGAPPERASAYITLGLPGSGKTTALRPLAWGHYRSTLSAKDRDRGTHDLPAGAAVIDADEIRVLIKEYFDGLGSNVVQSETASLTYGPRQEALFQGPCSGLLFDTVGDPLYLPKLVTRLIEKAYDVYLLMAKVDVEVAEERIMRRAVETGRVVSPAYLRSKQEVPEQALATVLGKGLGVTGWGVWDTSGAPAQLDGAGPFALRPSA